MKFYENAVNDRIDAGNKYKCDEGRNGETENDGCSHRAEHRRTFTRHEHHRNHTENSGHCCHENGVDCDIFDVYQNNIDVL